MKGINAMKKRMIGIFALLVVAGIAGGGYYYVSNKQSPEETYKQALSDAVSMNNDQLYGSFDIKSENTKFKGEIEGDINGKNGKARGDLVVDGKQDDVPITVDAELIVIETDKSEAYVKYNSVTSKDAQYNANVVSYFEPALNKWVKFTNEEEEKPTSFEEDGALASLDATAIFMPFTNLNEADKAKYVEVLNKYTVYTVEENIEDTQFKGLDARKFTVSVNKQAYEEFERELDSVLSTDSEFERLDSKFIDQLFGKDSILSANVYLKPKQAMIIGSEIAINLDDAVTETTFGSTVDKIDISVLIEDNRKANISVPSSSISEEEFQNLLSTE
jgi:hypothetical protein